MNDIVLENFTSHPKSVFFSCHKNLEFVYWTQIVEQIPTDGDP